MTITTFIFSKEFLIWVLIATGFSTMFIGSTIPDDMECCISQVETMLFTAFVLIVALYLVTKEMDKEWKKENATSKRM